MSARAVVDASVVLRWLVEEPLTAEAYLLLDRWRERGVSTFAPSLLPFEIANALYKRVRRGELTVHDARRLLDVAAEEGPRLDQDRGLHAAAVELALRLGHGACYDSQYLALAEREQCECWTADRRLWESVRDALPRVRWVGELSA